MRRVRKIVSIALSIVCFTSTLMACSNNEVTDNNETLTTAEKVTTTEPPTTTEEPTTEEPSTEYQYKGKEIKLLEAAINIDKIDNLTLEKGSKIYINEICNDAICNTDDISDAHRGKIAYSLVVYLLKEKNPEYISDFEDKYLPPGSPRYEIPYSDNYYIEYIYDNSVTFHYVKTSARGYAYFDLY